MHRFLIALIALSFSAGAVWAQSEAPRLGPDGSVGAGLSLRPGASWAADRLIPTLGLSGSLHLSPNWAVAGEGVLTLGRIRVSADDSPDRTDVSLSYGGLAVRYHLPPGISSNGWSASLLLGAGTARVRSALVGQEVGTDNFFIIEPGLSYHRMFRPYLGASVAAGYRFTPGSDPLPGLEAGDLQGTVLSVGMSLIRNP